MTTAAPELPGTGPDPEGSGVHRAVTSAALTLATRPSHIPSPLPRGTPSPAPTALARPACGLRGPRLDPAGAAAAQRTTLSKEPQP